MAVIAHKGHATFTEFYTDYLSGHTDRTSRELHFFGSTLAIFFLIALVLTGNVVWLVAAALSFYGFAWIGHLMFEKNRPASWRQPFYSFAAAWLMYWQLLTGQVSF